MIKNLSLKKLWPYLPRYRQKQFWLLLILMSISSISEVISIGAVLPFLGILTAPEQIYHNQFIQPLIQFLELTSPNQLIFPITILFIVLALLAGAIRLILLYAITRFSFMVGADISIDIFRRTLYQEYLTHVSRNSSEVINGVIVKTGAVVGGVVTPTMNFISSIILLIGIMGALFAINIIVALSVFISFGFLYWVITIYTKKQLKENSQIIADQSSQRIKSLQEGLGGIRDVLIDGCQKFYCRLYKSSDLPIRRAAASNAFIIQSPRYVMEAIGVSFIAAIAYMLTYQEGGVTAVIPVLGAIALGAQRLLPILQQAYGAYSSIKGVQASFKDVLELLNQQVPEYTSITENYAAPISFEREIKLTGLSFRYLENTHWVLENLNLSIAKGECIGFIGETGSGKSTLLDIIAGLVPPTSGSIMIDNQQLDSQNSKAWRAMHIAYVSQNVYLSDATIEENIAFGIAKDQIDHKQVERVAKQAHISGLIKGWKDGYQTLVGERGLCLSGGQRQRIGIARALYKRAKVLILDEATSALDDETESKVMSVINDLSGDLTILIIAHRLTTLKKCDRVVKLSKGNISVT
jgi:ATP-binding cassette, subfamily B, bacterial PglK